MKPYGTIQSELHAAIIGTEGRADDPTFPRARDETLGLLARRTPGATICPSEVAKALAAGTGTHVAEGWRVAMPAVHAAVDRLVADGPVQLSWKGETLATRAGPYRISRRSTS